MALTMMGTTVAMRKGQMYTKDQTPHTGEVSSSRMYGQGGIASVVNNRCLCELWRIWGLRRAQYL